MKALVKAKPELGLWMQPVPVPETGPTDDLIKVKKSATCCTDIDHAINSLNEILPDLMKRLGMKEGFDVGMEMSGAPSVEYTGARCMKPGLG